MSMVKKNFSNFEIVFSDLISKLSWQMVTNPFFDPNSNSSVQVERMAVAANGRMEKVEQLLMDLNLIVSNKQVKNWNEKIAISWKK